MSRLAVNGASWPRLRSYRVDGVLLAPASGTDTRSSERAPWKQASRWCVSTYGDRGMETDAVLLDNARGARECVRQHDSERAPPHRRSSPDRSIVQTGRERLAWI